MARNDGRSGSPKAKSKQSKAKSEAAPQPSAPSQSTGMPTVAPVEEAGGFQIFRPEPSRTKAASAREADGAQMPNGASTGQLDRDSRNTRDPAPAAAQATPPDNDADQPDAAIAQRVSDTVRSIVHEEMQRAAERLARSIISGTSPDATPKT